jgi:hypothetical protein
VTAESSLRASLSSAPIVKSDEIARRFGKSLGQQNASALHIRSFYNSDQHKIAGK